MEAVCILFGSKPNWKESKNLLAKMTFMDELKVSRQGREGGREGRGDRGCPDAVLTLVSAQEVILRTSCAYSWKRERDDEKSKKSLVPLGSIRIGMGRGDR